MIDILLKNILWYEFLNDLDAQSDFGKIKYLCSKSFLFKVIKIEFTNVESVSWKLMCISVWLVTFPISAQIGKPLTSQFAS